MRNISTFVCMSQPVGKHAGSFSFYILNTHPALHIRENRYLHTLQISTFYKMIKNQLFRKPNFVEFSKKTFYNYLQISTKVGGQSNKLPIYSTCRICNYLIIRM